MGVEFPGSWSREIQRTFRVRFQCRGALVSGLMPLWLGPRQEGQGEAEASPARRVSSASSDQQRRAERWGIRVGALRERGAGTGPRRTLIHGACGIWQSRGMRSRPKRRCALTIAGSDSGGGAGIQADLKTFAAVGVHGVSAVTCLTAQNPDGVLGVEAVSARMVGLQLRAISEGFAPAAAKTGMLYSAGLIEEVACWLEGPTRPALVVDPVMIATSGARLLKPRAVRAMRERLLPLAVLATPNLDEATVLTGIEIREPEDLRRAARELRDRYGCAALIKGGHLRGVEALDVFWDGREELLLSARRVEGVSSHGTGCTYSAAITAYLALGCGLARSVCLAKEYITRAIGDSVRVGRHAVLEHLWLGS